MQQPQTKRTGEGYVKKIVHEGIDCFALFDEDGNAIVITDNRSVTFFTAADRDITVRMLN
ncbi:MULTISPECIES: DUF1150 family protein [unclassified Rhizobium]|jgi:hypothetical protein|uniref:DUF1150 family protein n=1 Tax=unclassified Rhizobium TaxID=2613769 RepID=UPI000DE11CBC|nr:MULTISPECIES: DUF1150 family protein [unclassified Rhizobium]MBM7322414.1 DUF1150 family protein [Agrobacterium sp. S2]MDH7801293.1 hypothetical protein [Rhizobium sp. AN70]